MPEMSSTNFPQAGEDVTPPPPDPDQDPDRDPDPGRDKV